MTTTVLSSCCIIFFNNSFIQYLPFVRVINTHATTYLYGKSGLSFSFMSLLIVSALLFGKPLAIIRFLSTSSMGSSYKTSTTVLMPFVKFVKLKNTNLDKYNLKMLHFYLSLNKHTYWKNIPQASPIDIAPIPRIFLTLAAGVPFIFLGFHFEESTPIAILCVSFLSTCGSY